MELETWVFANDARHLTNSENCRHASNREKLSRIKGAKVSERIGFNGGFVLVLSDSDSRLCEFFWTAELGDNRAFENYFTLDWC